MSTVEEDIPKEERRSRRSSNEDDRSERKKKKKIRDDGGASSSRSASSSEHTKKKKKKSRGDDESVRSSHTSSKDKKKKKKLMEASEDERRSILDRLESKATVSTISSRGTADTDPIHEGTVSSQEDSSSRERKKKNKSKHGEDSSHRSKKSSSKEKHKKKEHRHSNSSRASSADSDGDRKPKARSLHDDEEEDDVKIGPAGASAPAKRKSSTAGMFTVRKGDGGKQWDENDQASLEENAEFSSSSVASGFSMPASSRDVRSSKADAVQVGAVHSTGNPDRIQNMLDRKFHEYDGTRGGEEKQEEDGEAAASRVGAHRETNVPDRIQNMLDQKFTEFGQPSQQSMSVEFAENSEKLTPAQQKMQKFQPTYVAKANPSNVRDKLQGSFNDDPNLDPEAHRNLAPAGSTRFSIWNAGQDKISVATPTPDVLANRLMDGNDEIGLNSVEKTEARLAAGLCPDCGRTRTHEKIKYGPFQAFRKLEPMTTPGHVYKGYCLFCNNLHDLRRYLHEPYLREQDLDGSLAVPLAAASEGDDKESASGGGDIPLDDEQDFARRKRRIQICLFIAVFAVIAGGIGLAVSFVGNNNASTPTTATAAPPTAAPGPLGWHQVGADISEPIESFGYKVSISGKGDRIAVASPKANTNVGRVDVYEFLNTTSEWSSVGQPVLGDFEDDLTGFDMDLSGDGKHLVIGYPGNGAGYVRIFRLSKGEWKQFGSTIKGTTAAGWFGASVAIIPDGTSIVVAAPYDTNDNGSEAGRVQVFTYDGSDWVQVGTDLFGRAALDHFGKSVDLSDDGTKLAVGAPNNDDRWQDGGQVHIFELVTTNEGIEDWKESLKQLKILGDEQGHEFGSSMSLSGFGDIVISSSLIASNDAGTVGGGDPRAVYIAYVDDVGEELGYGFPEIPGTLGLGYSCDIDYDGTKVVLSTLNLETVSGKAMMYDITGKANWYIYSDEYGGEKLGADEWLGDGPSVTLSEFGNYFAIGYESIVVDAKTKEAAPVVRVYNYGHGPSEEETEEGKEKEPKNR